MITLIPEEDWTDQVQIIGWLYQFYNIEPKAAVFAKNGKVTKEEIPAATQLFTPDWIVRYMVENSLGRLWVEGHPNDDLKSTWKYYLEEAEQEDSVKAQLETIRKEYRGKTFVFGKGTAFRSRSRPVFRNCASSGRTFFFRIKDKRLRICCPSYRT